MHQFSGNTEGVTAETQQQYRTGLVPTLSLPRGSWSPFLLPPRCPNHPRTAHLTALPQHLSVLQIPKPECDKKSALFSFSWDHRSHSGTFVQPDPCHFPELVPASLPKLSVPVCLLFTLHRKSLSLSKVSCFQTCGHKQSLSLPLIKVLHQCSLTKPTILLCSVWPSPPPCERSSSLGCLHSLPWNVHHPTGRKAEITFPLPFTLLLPPPAPGASASRQSRSC